MIPRLWVPEFPAIFKMSGINKAKVGIKVNTSSYPLMMEEVNKLINNKIINQGIRFLMEEKTVSFSSSIAISVKPAMRE